MDSRKEVTGQGEQSPARVAPLPYPEVIRPRVNRAIVGLQPASPLVLTFQCRQGILDVIPEGPLGRTAIERLLYPGNSFGKAHRTSLL